MDMEMYLAIIFFAGCLLGYAVGFLVAWRIRE